MIRWTRSLRAHQIPAGIADRHAEDHADDHLAQRVHRVGPLPGDADRRDAEERQPARGSIAGLPRRPRRPHRGRPSTTAASLSRLRSGFERPSVRVTSVRLAVDPPMLRMIVRSIRSTGAGDRHDPSRRGSPAGGAPGDRHDRDDHHATSSTNAAAREIAHPKIRTVGATRGARVQPGSTRRSRGRARSRSRRSRGRRRASAPDVEALQRLVDAQSRGPDSPTLAAITMMPERHHDRLVDAKHDRRASRAEAAPCEGAVAS